MESFVFETFIEKINEFSDNVLSRLGNDKEYKKEEQLYHYTSLESLQAIIQNQSFRATSIFMMNDPNELVHGLGHICEWFNENISKSLSQFAQNCNSQTTNVFVFSLSELNDNMHMWEKYGNKHRGVRIGFTPKNLVDYWKMIERITVLNVPVIYHDYGSKYLDPYGADFLKFKNDFSSAINSHFIDHKLNHEELTKLKYCSSIIASMIKRKEWAHEREWRIVCLTNGLIHQNIIGEFRDGKPIVKLENKRSETLRYLTNSGHDFVTQKDVLKIGSHAGDTDDVNYVLSLLYPPRTIFSVSKSSIQTR